MNTYIVCYRLPNGQQEWAILREENPYKAIQEVGRTAENPKNIVVEYIFLYESDISKDM